MASLPEPHAYSSRRQQPQKMVWWYWALLDDMVANPQYTKKELARLYNCSEVTIHLVTNSDVFQSYLAERRRGNSEALDLQIRHRLARVADKSLEHIETTLDKKRDAIPLEDLVTVADKTLERLGYGVKGSSVNVQTTGPTQVVVPVSLADLEAARKTLRESEAAKLKIEDISSQEL